MDKMILLSEWQSSQVEFWKQCVGAANGYEVSNFGRVRSWRTVRPLSNRGGTASIRRKTPRILTPYKEKWGYWVICIYNEEGKRKQRKIHRLVAMAFIPNPKELPSVNHLTGLKDDNRIDGLAWATASEQSKHAWAHGLQTRDRFASAKKMVEARKAYREVSDGMVRMIRNMLADGISQGQIRRWSGLKAATIQSIAVGRTYRDVA